MRELKQGFPLLGEDLEQRSKSSRFREKIGHQRSVGPGIQGSTRNLYAREDYVSLAFEEREQRQI